MKNILVKVIDYKAQLYFYIALSLSFEYFIKI